MKKNMNEEEIEMNLHDFLLLCFTCLVSWILFNTK